MWLIFIYPFYLGIALAWVWDKIKPLVKGGGETRILNFAALYLLLVVLPVMIMNYSCMPISFPVILSWTASGYFYGLMAAVVFMKYNP